MGEGKGRKLAKKNPPGNLGGGLLETIWRLAMEKKCDSRWAGPLGASLGQVALVPLQKLLDRRHALRVDVEDRVLPPEWGKKSSRPPSDEFSSWWDGQKKSFHGSYGVFVTTTELAPPGFFLRPGGRGGVRSDSPPPRRGSMTGKRSLAPIPHPEKPLRRQFGTHLRLPKSPNVHTPGLRVMGKETQKKGIAHTLDGNPAPGQRRVLVHSLGGARNQFWKPDGKGGQRLAGGHSVGMELRSDLVLRIPAGH